MKPEWCLHKTECICLSTRQGMCVGRLLKPTDHFPGDKANTHRWCLADDNKKQFLI